MIRIAGSPITVVAQRQLNAALKGRNIRQRESCSEPGSVLAHFLTPEGKLSDPGSLTG